MPRRKRNKTKDTLLPASSKNQTPIAGNESKLAAPTAIEQNAGIIKKSMFQRWESWLSIAAAIATVLAFVFDLPQKCGGTMTPESSRFGGVVKDESGQYVAGAKIEVKDASHSVKIVGSGQTLSSGEFNIIVQSKPEETVWVSVRKEGYKDFTGMQILAGNTVIILKKLESDLP